MKKMKKGFTIVELVIVIAVIAILSAVLIPTFSSVTDKAKKSVALQEATSAVTVVLAEEKGSLDEGYTYYFESGEYWYVIEEGELKLLNAKPDAIFLVDDEETTEVDERTQPAYTKANLSDLSAKVKVYKIAK